MISLKCKSGRITNKQIRHKRKEAEILKFATIGTSWITTSFIAAAKKTNAANPYAVYSRSEEKAKRFAEENGAETWFNDIDRLLETPVDFVYIASPNSMHVEQILKAIEKGKHVFCEKPLVYTEKQWQRVKDAAQKHHVFVFEGFRHLYSPNYTRLREALAEIGQIRSVLLQYVQYSSRYDAFKDGRVPNVFTKDYAGGALMDLGVYPLSMAIDLFGEPLDIDYFPVLLDNGVDGSGTLVLTYQRFYVTILCSKIAQATIPSEIHGEAGTLTVDHIAPITTLTLYDRKTNDQKHLQQKQDALDMVYELQAFVRMVEENDTASYAAWMERSRQVAKWSEKARHKRGIRFPGE